MSGQYGNGASGSSPPTVYLGGSMNAAEQIRSRNADLEARGFTVLSTWSTRDESHETPLESATIDWLELMRAKHVVICADTPSSSGGLWTEFGGAIMADKPTIVITGDGDTFNVFAYLPTVTIYKTWADYLAVLDSNLVRHVAVSNRANRDQTHGRDGREIYRKRTAVA